MAGFIFKPEIKIRYGITALTDVIYLNILREEANGFTVDHSFLSVNTRALSVCRNRLLDRELIRKTSKGYALTDRGMEMVTHSKPVENGEEV